MGSLYAIATPVCLDSCNAGSDAELAIDACTVALDRLSVRSSRSFSYCETRESKVVWSRVGGEELDLIGVGGIALRERHRDAGQHRRGEGGGVVDHEKMKLRKRGGIPTRGRIRGKRGPWGHFQRTTGQHRGGIYAAVVRRDAVTSDRQPVLTQSVHN